MMKHEQIRELIQLLDQTSLTDIEVRSGEEVLVLRKSPAPGLLAPAAVTPPAASLPAAAPAPDAAGTAPAPAGTPAPVINPKWKPVKSPIVGTFYRAPAPDAPLFVTEGQHLDAGTVVCIVEAMKIMNEIKTDLSGTVKKICVENAHPVQFDEVLYWVETVVARVTPVLMRMFYI